MKIEITEEDRDWIERRAYDLYRGWTRNKVTQDIRPQDGFEYWLVNATTECMILKLKNNENDLILANRHSMMWFDEANDERIKLRSALQDVYREVDLDAMDDNEELQRQLARIARIAENALGEKNG